MANVFVPGIPAPQGSKRHLGNGVMVESSRRLRPWRLDVTTMVQEAHDGEPLERAEVELNFLFPRPRGHYRTGRNSSLLRSDAPVFHTTRPDVDKLCRAILDAMVVAGAIRDDSCVVSLTATKMYSQTPGCDVIWHEKTDVA